MATFNRTLLGMRVTIEAPRDWRIQAEPVHANTAHLKVKLPGQKSVLALIAHVEPGEMPVDGNVRIKIGTDDLISLNVDSGWVLSGQAGTLRNGAKMEISIDGDPAGEQTKFYVQVSN